MGAVLKPSSGKVAVHRKCSSDSLCMPFPSPGAVAQAQRWDGHAREATDWNELRRDPELFFPNGNTSIYLYSRGRSQRGPSFRIPYEFLLYSGCRPLVEQSLVSTLEISPYNDLETDPRSGDSYLYLHAPVHLSREESFAYHVTTRNFFAWLMGVPIVGLDPVSALLSLKDRMDLWRDAGSDNLKAICDYIREQGYGDISELEAQLPRFGKPTLYRDRGIRFDGFPTLAHPPKRSRSVASRQASRRTLRFSESFPNHPHIANLIRPQKKDHDSERVLLRDDHLATIAYEDTALDAPPSTAWTSKPKLSRSIGRSSNYTEIVVPNYGNGLSNPASAVESLWSTRTGFTAPKPARASVAMATSEDGSAITASPSEAYMWRRSQQSSPRSDTTPALPCPSPSPSLSSSSSSIRSNVPSLSSTYSTDEQESPILASPTIPDYPAATAAKGNDADEQSVKIVERHHEGSVPDLIIDELIGELEAAGLGRKPAYSRVDVGLVAGVRAWI